MKAARIVFLLLVLVLAVLATVRGRAQDGEGGPEPSPEVSAFLAEWAERMRGVDRLRVVFTQKKKLRILREPRESRGRAVLLGKKLRMTMQNARGETEIEMAVDAGGEVRVHYPRLARLEVYDLGAAGASGAGAAAMPFPIFGEDVERLPETYEIALEREGEGDAAVDVLVMTPRAAASPVAELRMRLRDFRVAGLVQKSRRGDTVEIAISEFAIGAEVEPGEVELVVPEGTKVVHVLGEPGEGEGEKKDDDGDD